MRTEISLNGLPTYPDGTTIKLNTVNYFFGKNGSGKTTFCNFIHDNPNTLIDNNQELVTYDQNFRETKIINGMAGIYTFGDNNPTLLKEKQSVLDTIKTEIKEKEAHENSRKGYIASKEKAFDSFADRIWQYKSELIQNYGKEVFKGYNSEKRKFADEVLKTFEESSKATGDLSKIDEYWDIINNDKTEGEPEHKLILVRSTYDFENYKLLSEPIISDSDNDLNKYYEKLNNLDWVKNGRGLLSYSDNHCPFCNSLLDESFKKQFKGIFSEVYGEKIASLNTIVEEYTEYLDEVIKDLGEIASNSYAGHDYSDFNIKSIALEKSVSEIKSNLEKKKSEPMRILSIIDLKTSIEDVNRDIENINSLIRAHNKLVEERKKLPDVLSKLIWKKFSTDNYEYCASQKKQLNGIESKIRSEGESVNLCAGTIEKLEERVRELNKTISNIELTVSGINNLLQNFGFTNFRLAVDSDNPGTYVINRPSGGNNDIKTLSEGEYKLVSLLYLYYYLNGSLSDTESTKHFVVVMDDPVNSMDSDTMNIASTLTKSLIAMTVDNNSRIDQMVIFTHNVFFYKEIEYRSSSNSARISYHLITKKNNISRIDTTKRSKIYSNYELLWSEYCESNSPTSSLNCMRRILEYYFKSLVGTESLDDCRSKFDVKDQIIFDALINALNSGSHSIFDPIDTYVDDEQIERYKTIFKQIFEYNSSVGHYNKMMQKYESGSNCL